MKTNKSDATVTVLAQVLLSLLRYRCRSFQVKKVRQPNQWKWSPFSSQPSLFILAPARGVFSYSFNQASFKRAGATQTSYISVILWGASVLPLIQERSAALIYLQVFGTVSARERMLELLVGFGPAGQHFARPRALSYLGSQHWRLGQRYVLQSTKRL